LLAQVLCYELIVYGQFIQTLTDGIAHVSIHSSTMTVQTIYLVDTGMYFMRIEDRLRWFIMFLSAKIIKALAV
jgi:hypothetical protein